MDRAIPQEEQKRKRRRRMMIGGGTAVILFASFMAGAAYLQPTLPAGSLQFSTVGTGMLEMTVNASGTIAPAFEEIINSPIDSRVVEVYKKMGDSVDVSEPLLKLDIQSVQTEYDKLLDEGRMKQHRLQQLKLNNRTKLKDLAMQIKVSKMKLDRMQVELRNEQFLDSLGAGTPDKVRQVELNYKVSQLEHEQLCQQYESERQVMVAEEQVQDLEYSIFKKSLTEMQRTLQEARIFAPRKATLTYLNDQIGVRVGKGERLAVIADLSRFQAKCTVSDSYSDCVLPGNKAIVRSGEDTWEGVVSHVTPTSQDGTIDFTVQLNEGGGRLLRSGLKTDVYVVHGVKEGVPRIANEAYYLGAGVYELFVRTSAHQLERRTVTLGESSWDYVEVVSGLREGEEVVVSDMTHYKDKTDLKLD